jgi:hypothetical protein
MQAIDKFIEILEPIREAAKQCGYAIAIHGSVQRDIDLIAVPWIVEAQRPDILVDKVKEAANGKIHGDWRLRPHGRLVRIIDLGDEVYIDLSIMPRKGAGFV